MLPLVVHRMASQHLVSGEPLSCSLPGAPRGFVTDSPELKLGLRAAGRDDVVEHRKVRFGIDARFEAQLAGSELAAESELAEQPNVGLRLDGKGGRCGILGGQVGAHAAGQLGACES